MDFRLPSNKELLVLRLLRKRAASPMYGLELVKASKGELGRASIYVVLARMEDKGYLRSFTPRGESEHPGLPRPRYRIAALGEKALRGAEAAAAAMASPAEPTGAMDPA
jgi:DNA-binding PadR family transcriptional regulator